MVITDPRKIQKLQPFQLLLASMHQHEKFVQHHWLTADLHSLRIMVFDFVCLHILLANSKDLISEALGAFFVTILRSSSESVLSCRSCSIMPFNIVLDCFGLSEFTFLKQQHPVSLNSVSASSEEDAQSVSRKQFVDLFSC